LRREASGRSKRITKWFANRADAEAYQTETNAGLVRAGTEGFSFNAIIRSDAIAARQTLDAAGHTEVNLLQLARAYSTHNRGAHAGLSPVAPALDEFLQEKEIVEGCAPRTVRTLRNRLRAWLKANQIGTLGELTREHMETMRARPGVGAQTRRNDMAAVSVFCTWLLDKGRLDHHPLKGLRRPKLPQANKATFTAEECGKLLEAARQYLAGRWLGSLAVLLFTGCRPSELAQTRLIYGRPTLARIEGGKLRGRANRTVRLMPAAVAWLELVGKPETVLPLHTRARRTIAQNAGLKWQTDVTRHTYISHRLAAVRDDALVAAEAGTSQAMIHRHYHSLKMPADARKFAALTPK
jgi:integrase